ncbi:MAG: phage holin family protein [Nocardiopsaceae bacterium]|nr:phage holin family protein [Nocardiopsaceae bacterium]
MPNEHPGRNEPAGEPSTRELTSRLGQQLTTLVRSELALARAELFTRGRQAVMGGGLFAGAGVAGLGAYLVLLAAAVAGIAVALPVWASALIVGGALAALAGVLALGGRRRLARGVPPLQMTTDTVRRDLAELTSRNGHPRQRRDAHGGGLPDPNRDAAQSRHAAAGRHADQSRHDRGGGS